MKTEIAERNWTVTYCALNFWWLLVGGFILIPLFRDQFGLFFVSEAANGCVSIFWYLIPFLVPLPLFVMKRWWVGAAATLFCLLWTPICILSIYFFDDYNKVTTNSNKHLDNWEPLSDRFKRVRLCSYSYSGGTTARGHWTQTLEEEFFPGLKYVRTIDISDRPRK